MVTPDPQSDPQVPDPPASQDQQPTTTSKQPNAWLQLLRLPNLFTVPGDPAAGFILGYLLHGGLKNPLDLPAMLLAGCAGLMLYAGGLVFNDVFDLSEDRRDRPYRPIASGRIPLWAALLLGISLLSGGFACAWAVSIPAGTLAGVLAALVLLYDALLKRLPVIGPLTMGACRGLSFLLGVTAAAGWVAFQQSFIIYSAALLTAYVAAVTVLARGEARTMPLVVKRWLPLAALATGYVLIPLAILVIKDFIHGGGPDPPFAIFATLVVYGPVVLLFALPAILACVTALRCALALGGRASPAIVQHTVGRLIRNLLFVQVSLAVWFTAPGLALAGVLLVVFYPLSLSTARRFYAS